MEFSQDKLSKKEWDAAEVPVSESEQKILTMLTKGHENVNLKWNDHNSIFTHLKIEFSEVLGNYIYMRFLADIINALAKKYNVDFISIQHSAKAIVIKTADKIRMEKTSYSKLVAADVFEFVLIEHMEQLFKNKHGQNKQWMFHYFTLSKLVKNSIPYINPNIILIVSRILTKYEDEIDLTHIIANSKQYIERNSQLLKFADMELYDHQKQIITVSKDRLPKLVLYIAPTATGKTMSPLALASNHCIIFVCAARHVGLAFARAAISMNKRIAFAFGCSSAENVRLHYFSAKKYTTNTKTGGIYKVDNTVGTNVEIMICDIRSYIPAMHYMMAFNEPERIITYWDEPTITMDYPTHPFHEIIKKNWNENLIPNMVLSSATLPKLHELSETIADFTEKFPGAIVHNIVSHDCRKSIPIINRYGYIEMPHYMSPNYDEIQQVVEHCEGYLTLMRYYDLAETSAFITHVDPFVPNPLKISRHFASIDDITMQNVKLHYLRVLKGMGPDVWQQTYPHFMAARSRFIIPNDRVDTQGNVIKKSSSIGPGIVPSLSKNGQPLSKTQSVCLPPSPPQTTATEDGNFAVYVSTKDAYTLTGGPTIFIANEVDKIARFCIQQSNIPACVMSGIMEKIEFNNKVIAEMNEVEKELTELQAKKKAEDGAKTVKKDKSKHKDTPDGENKRSKDKDSGEPKSSDLRELSERMNQLQSLVKLVSLNETFVPNKLLHIAKWGANHVVPNAFTSNVDEDTVVKIMSLDGIADSWKILLLMGIGVFTLHPNPAYTEIMKNMADNQHLFMIIASSDYIYGTNYQFCHGYISKDLDLTQEKIIQAMGRIGRNNIQQEYSIRFRDDEKIRQLFTREEFKQEVINMNILFNSHASL